MHHPFVLPIWSKTDCAPGANEVLLATTAEGPSSGEVMISRVLAKESQPWLGRIADQVTSECYPCEHNYTPLSEHLSTSSVSTEEIQEQLDLAETFPSHRLLDPVVPSPLDIVQVRTTKDVPRVVPEWHSGCDFAAVECENA